MTKGGNQPIFEKADIVMNDGQNEIKESKAGKPNQEESKGAKPN